VKALSCMFTACMYLSAYESARKPGARELISTYLYIHHDGSMKTPNMYRSKAYVLA